MVILWGSLEICYSFSTCLMISASKVQSFSSLCLQLRKAYHSWQQKTTTHCLYSKWQYLCKMFFRVLIEICMERCVGVGSYLLTWFLLFIIPSWGFLRAKAQSIWRHDWILQFNIRFSFVFKSFPASSRDKDRSVLFMGGTSPISTCYLLLCCWELHPTYLNYRGRLKLFLQSF